MAYVETAINAREFSYCAYILGRRTWCNPPPLPLQTPSFKPFLKSIRGSMCAHHPVREKKRVRTYVGPRSPEFLARLLVSHTLVKLSLLLSLPTAPFLEFQSVHVSTYLGVCLIIHRNKIVLLFTEIKSMSCMSFTQFNILMRVKNGSVFH